MAASTPSVGSSSSSSGRSASTARASATRRRCPVDSPAPSSPTGVPSGMSSAAARGRRPASDPAWRRARRGGCCRRRCRRTAPVAAAPRPPGAARRRRSMSARSTPPTVIRPASGAAKPEQQVQQGRLAGAAGPADPEQLARCDGQAAAPSSTGPPRPSTPHVLDAQRIAWTGPVPWARTSSGPRRAVSSIANDLAGGGQALGGVVEAGADRAQRQVDLGREDQHQQRGAPGRAALDETQPDRHRDQCDRQGGQQLQDQRGQEGDPQRAHGGPAVGLGQLPQPRRLPARPAERDQHVQPGDQVEEVVAEHGEGAPLAAGGSLGVQPDQDHEDRDQRHGHRDDQPGHPVGEQDPGRHDGGYDRGDQQGRQVAAEVAVEPVEAAGGQRGQLAGRGQPGVPGRQPQDVGDEPGPQLTDHIGCRPVRGELARPGQHGPAGDHHEKAQQHRRERW